MMLLWLRCRLAQADAEAFMREHGAEAYGEPRYRECDGLLPDGTMHGRTPEHWLRSRSLWRG